MNFLNSYRRFAHILKFQRVQQVRTLFSAETLGTNIYQTNCRDALNNVEGADQFKWDLHAYVENESTKDSQKLKNALEVLVHLVKSDSDDVHLIKKTLYAFDSTDGLTDKAKRSIGNLVMQYIHSNNMPNVALDFFSDIKLSEFFAGFKCTLMLLDLLYINGQFDKIIEIDMENRSKIWSSKTNCSKFLDVLVFGACYKLNTAESFYYAHKLWSTIEKTSQFRRSLSFFAAITLNQGKSTEVIQMLENLETNFVDEQIKLLALADVGNVKEIIERVSTWKDNKKLSKHKISKNVMDGIYQRVQKNSTADDRKKFQETYNVVIAENGVSIETLEQLLDRTINSRITIRG
ncbi:pentatricopeptide repeat-containing protein 2, mitochondrial-like [Contarinia nasturtii]|uniref:pentatricopeptide repeat-containing protein 2, mitochondrial-like n=1 Tax=Contarinia nasturtii TaxID=265458 RepID=UPI0012D3B3DA|nr:pentatricopeptide repeat-containing protein 2, mitochondrial-like [Contarinia nasturtii]